MRDLDHAARFHMIFDAVVDAVFVIGEAGRIEMANIGATRLFGYRQEELLGQSLELLLSEESCARHPVLATCSQEAFRLDLAARHKDGRFFYVNFNRSPVARPDREEAVVVMRDISATKEFEAMLRRNSQEFQALADNAPDLILRFDCDMRILYVNPVIESIMDCSHSECFGKLLDEAGLPAETVENLRHVVNGVLDSGAEAAAEWYSDTAGVDRRHFQARLAPERDADGRVVSVLMISRDISDRKHHEEQLRHHATHDALTGLPNRTLVRDRLQQALLHQRRGTRQVAVAYLDIDNFKDINDIQGHAVGDELLRQTAARLVEVLRPGDTVGRQGGDEFVLLLPDLALPQDLTMVAEKILGALTRPFKLGGRDLVVTASLGVVNSLGEDDPDVLLSHADLAMYRAKADGRDTFRLFTPDMDATIRARVDLDFELRGAIERDELELHYQPRVSLGDGKVVAMEALLRWNHPRLGLVMPSHFIAVAEETGVIVPIGYWVLEAACRQVRAWQDAGLPPLKVSVNLSARQFRDPALAGRVAAALTEFGLAPEHLELEITESMVMHDVQSAIATMHGLKQLGLSLSVDDFGTGYSSLAYLKQFPVDVLKVDRSFVSNATTDPNDAAIVRTIVTLGHALGLSVVGEGAETEVEAAFLHRVGCDELQGYYFSRPLAVADAERLLNSGRFMAMANLLSERLEDIPIVLAADAAMRDTLAQALRYDKRNRIACVGSADEAMECLLDRNAAVILCGQRLPDMSGVELLERIRQSFPAAVRILVADDRDAHACTAAVHRGVAHAFLRHGWSDRELGRVINAAVLDANPVRTFRHEHRGTVFAAGVA